MKIDRRSLIQILGVAAPAGSASAQSHRHDGKSAPAISSPRTPRCFAAGQYQLLRTLCQYIIPADAGSGGAVEGGVPEFIDLLASENAEYRRNLSGGMLWLDAHCVSRFGSSFLKSTEEQQRQMLDFISVRANAQRDPNLQPGIQFFAFLRQLTLDGYFTSKPGIEYLRFRGNGALTRFDGCPTSERDPGRVGR